MEVIILMLKSSRGFTLIELLIVIAIILISIAIALPNFLEAQIRAKVVRASADIRALATGQESYMIDWHPYTDDCFGQNQRPKPACVLLTTPIEYMREIPLDPFGI